MEKLHGMELEQMMIKSLVQELDSKGSLHVLRHGFKFYGKTFQVAQFKPAHGLNPEIQDWYESNRLTVTRQVTCHPGNNDTIDLVFALNGIPIATCELKNPGTGQNWKNAVKQYKYDRNPKAPLFDFKKRALVHFAADPNEVHMTTRLEKGNTYFLPFNRGSEPGSIKCGYGNPLHPSGYRTGYFWEEVLQRDSFIDIVGSFIFVETRQETRFDESGGARLVKKERVVFPRYHQLDAIRKLVSASRVEGPGNNYLIQHSAGSGKTNSISWLSHRLSSLHSDQDEPIFSCVIVITDRQVLDQQLQDAIYQIEHQQGVVQAIDEDSKQLAKALTDGTRIVVTTLQKFPFVLRGLLKVAEDTAGSTEAGTVAERRAEYMALIATRKYAVIVDEAHSSQTGETAREMKAILGEAGKTAAADGDETDWEDGLNQVMASRGKQPNLSFFAFTATPKGKTLEIFGRKVAGGKPEPFHIYSMRQAIEEGFILDVLRNYTTYKTYFRIAKSVENDPNLPKKKTARALFKFLVLHPTNIQQKTEIIVEHFRENIRDHLGGRAKAMVVASSRLHAVRYMLAFQKYINENGYKDVCPVVAFSGTVKDETGIEFTEPGMNIDVVTGKSIGEGELPDRFDSDHYQVLLVANKYQTGFDQPKLMAMYVDKRLDGVQAVQTLSRLNRKIPGKQEPFVLDFVNEWEDIHKAFKPYYDATSLQEESNPQQLEMLKHNLDQYQVYHWSEVEAFAKVFYKSPDTQEPADHARMQACLQPSVDRFKGLRSDDERQAFRDKLKGYVSVYAFLSQILPYTDPELEMLYSFGRFLAPHLPSDRDDERVNLDGDVDLQYYRIQRTFSGSIQLGVGETEGVKSPTQVGTGKAKDEKLPLSEIIDILNERLGTEFTNEDRLFFAQILSRAAADEDVKNTALANSLERFEIGARKMIERIMVERMSENDKIVTRYLEDGDFQNEAFPILAKAIFEAIRAEATEGE
ncbi:MAG: type I restriction endonuclease [Fimbriimonadaceae bacterium]